MANQVKEFKNDNIEVKVEQGANCLYTFDITVTPQSAAAAYVKALKEVSKDVSIPGFRKGKAPEAMLTQRFASTIDREFRDTVLNTAFREALNLTQIYPYREKDAVKNVNVVSCSREDGARFKITFEAFPEIPPVNPADLHIHKQEPKPISAADVSEELEQLAYRQAVWEDVADRAVQEGDFVDVDIVALEDKHERSICKDTRFLVAEGKMGNWMRKLVLGLKSGENAEGMSEKEEGSTVEHFKPTLCRITVKGIKTAKLPELTDEFATKFGAQSMEDLKEKIGKTLEKRAEDEVRQQIRKVVHEELLKHYPFDLPESLFESEKESRLHAKMHWLDHQKMPAEKREELTKEFQAEAAHEAYDALRTQFLLYKIIQDQRLEVSQEELLQELVKQMMLPEEERIIDEKEDIEATRSELKRVILFRKALDYVSSQR